MTPEAAKQLKEDAWRAHFDGTIDIFHDIARRDHCLMIKHGQPGGVPTVCYSELAAKYELGLSTIQDEPGKETSKDAPV